MSDIHSIALSGLKTQEFHINQLANDLANANTPNYKSTELTFTDLTLRKVQGENTSPLLRSGLGSAITQSGKNFTTGPLIAGGQWNQVAIHGQGFFAVEGSDNQILYTRNSQVSIDDERYLTTSEGLRLADNIQIPEDAIEIFIRNNGDVEVTLPDEGEPQLAGSIKLSKFTNPETLNPIGSGIYALSASTSEPTSESPGSPGYGELLQHQTEGSNVSMVETLMQLTMAQRVYQLNAKAMQIADELERITNEIRS